MTNAQALFILDLLCVMAGCYKRTVRPSRWSVRNSDGVIVVRIYEALI